MSKINFDKFLSKWILFRDFENKLLFGQFIKKALKLVGKHVAITKNA